MRYMEDVRRELYRYIEMYGTLDPKTLEKSRQLDLLIAREMGNWKH